MAALRHDGWRLLLLLLLLAEVEVTDPTQAVYGPVLHSRDSMAGTLQVMFRAMPTQVPVQHALQHQMHGGEALTRQAEQGNGMEWGSAVQSSSRGCALWAVT
jgi:hypothetical protein